jgi:phage tail sheath protein FI
VATSITAFIGRAARGDTDKAVIVHNFGEFETIFGGLWSESALGFSVRDFFLNGGSTAVVVRLYNPGPAVTGVGDRAELAVGGNSGLQFVAANKGKWGVGLRVTVDQTNTTDAVAKTLGGALSKADLFNLTVTDTTSGRSERYLNLTVKDSPRRVDKVLEAESALLRYKVSLDTLGTRPTFPLAPPKDALSVAEDAVAQAKADLVAKQNQSPPPSTTTEKTALDAAITALNTAITNATNAVSDGTWLNVESFLPQNGEAQKKGLFALEQVDLFNLLCIPPYRAPTDTIDVDPNLVASAAVYCEKRRAMLLLDSPKNWTTVATAVSQFNDASNEAVGTRSANSALFFPRLRYPNPLHDNQDEVFSAVGAVAGVFARTDGNRGVWKAPAGMEATLFGVPQLSVLLNDPENGQLNPLGINCLRAFPVGGRVVWGARTLRGADQLADEYKYIPVRRTALFIEESLFRGLKWAVFEPNDEPLWAQIRLNVGAFMHDLFRQGAFQGGSPRDAYFVKCDKETTTQTDINLGIVNVVVGFAPLKPAEFVIIKLQQIAGQIAV